VNGDIFKPAKRAESHLRGDVEAHDGHHRQGHCQRLKNGEGPARHVQPRERDEHNERGQHQDATDLVHPLADAQTSNCDDHQRREDDGADDHDKPRRPRQPFASGPHNVPEILSDLKTGLRGIEDGKQPEIPRDEKSRQLSESNLGPLIEPALERI
jgi:hypothetical protein